ncbi:ubiquitin carboxyl-terminal hydrolase 34 [Pelomyxa schiedti]|nr:ubiquitin carboxyl-terminal hydrolase 34 [Pelomyxa schiedti]
MMGLVWLLLGVVYIVAAARRLRRKSFGLGAHLFALIVLIWRRHPPLPAITTTGGNGMTAERISVSLSGVYNCDVYGDQLILYVEVQGGSLGQVGVGYQTSCLCGNCVSEVTVSKTWIDWPSYNYSGLNQLEVIPVSNTLCLSSASITVYYTTTDTSCTGSYSCGSSLQSCLQTTDQCDCYAKYGSCLSEYSDCAPCSNIFTTMCSVSCPSEGGANDEIQQRQHQAPPAPNAPSSVVAPSPPSSSAVATPTTGAASTVVVAEESVAQQQQAPPEQVQQPQQQQPQAAGAATQVANSKEEREKFAALFKTYEVIVENDPVQCVEHMAEYLTKYANSQLPPEQQTYFATVALPSFMKKALGIQRLSEEGAYAKIMTFSKQIIDVWLSSMQIGATSPELTDVLPIIFNVELPYYSQRPIGLELPNLNGPFAHLQTPPVWFSSVVVELVNYFGNKNGFSIFIENIGKGHPKCPVSDIRAFVEIVYLIHGNQYFITNAFNTLMGQLREPVVSRLHNLSAEEVKLMKNKDIELLNNYLTPLLEKVMSEKAAGEIVENLFLSVALKCFQSSNLEKRIFGLSLILTMLTLIQNAEQRHVVMAAGVTYLPKASKWMTTPRMTQWIETNNIMDLLFGPSAHQQLISRGSEIIRFMAKAHCLTVEHLKTMWSKIMDAHEVVSSAMTKALSTEARYFLPDQVEIVLGMIKALPFSSLNMNVLALIYGFSNSFSTLEHKTSMMQLMWEILSYPPLSPNAPTFEIRAQALAHLQECVKLFTFRMVRTDWITKLIDSMKKSQSNCYTYELFKSVLASFTFRTDMETKETLWGFLLDLDKEQQLLDTFFGEISAYCSRATFPRDTNGYDTLKEFRARLDWLNFVVSSALMLKSPHMQLLWDLMVTHAVCQEVSDEFFSWLMASRVPKDTATTALTAYCLLNLFQHKIFNNVEYAANVKTATAFRCFKQCFCDVNANTAKDQITWTIDKPDTFEVLVSPKHLTGYSTLWNIAFLAPSVIADQSVALIYQLYMQCSPALREAVSNIGLHEEFLDTCLNYLSSFTEVPSVESQVRCLTILKQYLAYFDTPLSTAKSHGLITRGKPLTVRVTASGDTPINFSLDLHSNVTVGDLRAHIKQKAGNLLQQNDITLQSNRELLQDDSQTLQQLQFVDKQIVIVSLTEKLTTDQQTVNRVRGAVSGNAVAATKPAAPSGGMKSLLQNAPSDIEERISQLLEVCPVSRYVATVALSQAKWEVNAATFSLYEEANKQEIQAEADKLEAMDNANQSAMAVGFGKVMTMQQQQQAYGEHPGCLIAANHVLFGQLFQILAANEPSVCSLVWEILMSIPTSKKMQEAVHTLQFHGTSAVTTAATMDISTTPTQLLSPSSTVPDWSELFDSKSNFKMLYSLQIVDSILFPLDEKSIDELSRVRWCVHFLTHGGLEYIYNVLCSSISETLHKAPVQSSTSSIHKGCLAFMLKIVEFFLHVLHLSTNESGGNLQTKVASFIPQHISTLLKAINFKQLQDLLLQMTWHTSRQPAPDRSDGEMVMYAMSLIAFCISSNPAELFQHFATSENLLQSMQVALLQCPEPSIRQACSDGLFTLVAHVNSNSALLFLITQLLRLLPLPDQCDKTLTKYCRQYFRLLCRVFDLAFSSTEIVNNSELHLHSIAKNCTKYLLDRPILEIKLNDVDDYLVGLLCLLHTLVSHSDTIKQTLIDEFSNSCKSSFVHMLYNDLFALKTAESAPHLPKCKSIASRSAASQLLIELCKNHEQNFSELVELLAPHHPEGVKIPRWDYHPGAQDKSSSGFVGLSNQGNTCYMNSLLQQLFMIKGLVRTILSVNANELKETASEQPSSNQQATKDPTANNLLVQMQAMFTYLQESEKGVFSTQAFCNAYKAVGVRLMEVHGQQDVHEFFNVLWQLLEQQLKGTPQEKQLPNFFVGSLAHQIRSIDKAYPYCSVHFEDFHVISLDIKNKRTLKEALDLFVIPDKLEGDNTVHVDKFNSKINVSKRMCIKRLPQTLILHLKRLEYDLNTNRKVKLNDYLEFPNHLNMRPWTLEGLCEAEGVLPAEGEGMEEVVNHPPSYYEYQLVGVIVHSGGADSGHYYSIIKDRASGKWYDFNDNTVSRFDMKTLPQECYGGKTMSYQWNAWLNQSVKVEVFRTASAYMLFYERVQILESSGSGEVTIPDSPTGLYKEVHEENTKFLRDRQFFDQTYFDFMFELIKLLSFEPVLDLDTPFSPVPFQTLLLVTKFTLDTLAHAKYSNSLGDYVNQLKLSLGKHMPACRWFLSFVMTTGKIKEFLLDCPVERVRVHFSDLIIHVLKSLSPCESSQWGNEFNEPPAAVQPSSVLRFMDAVLDLLEASRSSWKQFKQYFKVILGFASLGSMQRHYLIQKRILFLFSDWLVGSSKGRVSVMDDETLPDLAEYIATISVVVRGCLQGPPGRAETPYALSNTALLTGVSFKDILDKNFLKQMLELHFNPIAEAEILQHCSWEEAVTSRHILDTVLSALGSAMNTSDSEKVPTMLAHLETLLHIPDTLQAMRIQNTLTPSNWPGCERSALFLLHEHHTRNVAAASSIVLFIIKTTKAIAGVSQFMCLHPDEVSWIESFLENKSRSLTSADQSNETSAKSTEVAEWKSALEQWSTWKALTIKPIVNSSEHVPSEREAILMAEIREVTEGIEYLKQFYIQEDLPLEKMPALTIQDWHEAIKKQQIEQVQQSNLYQKAPEMSHHSEESPNEGAPTAAAPTLPSKIMHFPPSDSVQPPPLKKQHRHPHHEPTTPIDTASVLLPMQPATTTKTTAPLPHTSQISTPAPPPTSSPTANTNRAGTQAPTNPSTQTTTDTPPAQVNPSAPTTQPNESTPSPPSQAVPPTTPGTTPQPQQQPGPSNSTENSTTNNSGNNNTTGSTNSNNNNKPETPGTCENKHCANHHPDTFLPANIEDLIAKVRVVFGDSAIYTQNMIQAALRYSHWDENAAITDVLADEDFAFGRLLDLADKETFS